ncbi:hypothetical protein Aperf_G00000035446 [Anoplocephala perfoliata]
MTGYLCGVEGGSSSSEVVIVSFDDGEECSRIEGPHINQWFLGVEKAVARVLGLVAEALKKANLPPDTRFKAMGLTLSGCDSDDNCRDFEAELYRVKPELAERFYVCNDCLGTMFSVTEKGGIIIIAGTGSNCKLIREDLTSYGVGGFGYLLQDEASAFWIAHEAVKTYIDNEEEIKLTEYDTSAVKKLIFDHFGLRTNADLLEPHYHFNKEHYSKLCKKLADLAVSGDALCRHIFYKAGFILGSRVMTVLRKADPEWHTRPEGIEVVCRGKVFDSWDLLKEGFADRVVPDLQKNKLATSLRLRLLTSSVAVGAAHLIAYIVYKKRYPRKNELKQLAVFRA